MDKLKLLYEMKSKGFTVGKLCDCMRISKSAFYRKCNGTSQFTQKEIEMIVDLLKLDSPMGIFFKNKVS